MSVGDGAVENPAKAAEDVNGGDDDGHGGDYREDAHYGYARPAVAEEAAEEDVRFGDEAGKAGKAEAGEAGDIEDGGKPGHTFCQTAHFVDVAGVRAAVDHTDEAEEKAGHYAVAEHLDDGAFEGHHV